MAIMTNFDRLNGLRTEAARCGAGSKAWIEFATVMFDSFPALYQTAKSMNSRIDQCPMAEWQSLSDSWPDSDQTVLLYDKDANEPVWLGYHDGLKWIYVDEFEDTNPTHWADIPDPPSD